MVWTYHGHSIPLKIYHGVPNGWHVSQIIAEHERLGGQFNLRGTEATEPGAPVWLPDRREWLQYRATLYRVADGIIAGDAACIELAVRFIELRYIGSYSGYIRALLSRRLKNALLTESQHQRLHVHFSALVLNKDRTNEFREYVRLWRRFISSAQLQCLIDQLKKQSDGEARISWLLAKLRLNEPINLD